jgi:hypothetical protein
MSIREALERVADASPGSVDPWTRARALLDEPWSVAVVGRVGAGKTSLVNRLTGGARPVGLGGVTRSVERVDWGDRALIDTPGIDDPFAAIEVLGPVLDPVDAVIWVVDGLQPMTGSERDVVRDTLPDGVALWVVVSRVDLLDPDEVGSVLERVRALAAPHGPAGVVAADLRAGAPGGVGEGAAPGRRRRARLAELLAPQRAAFAARPAPLRPDQVIARWRDEVRALVRDVERRIERGSVGHEVEALARLSAGAPQVLAAVARAAGDPSPILPLPEPPVRTALGQVAAGLSGAEGARRALRAVAARWLGAGELAIREDWPGAADRDREARAFDHLARAWDALDAALTAVG